MEECMTRVSTRLASKEVRYMTYCRLRLEHLLEENGRKLTAAKSKERDGKILARLLNASLVLKDTSSMTVEVLKGATKLLRRRQPEVADFLRSGTKCWHNWRSGWRTRLSCEDLMLLLCFYAFCKGGRGGSMRDYGSWR